MRVGTVRCGNVVIIGFIFINISVLFEVEVMEGALVCPETGREFPITRGIPNMLLTEEEV